MPKFEINWLEDRSDEGMLEEVRRVAALLPGRRLTPDAFNYQSKISASAVIRRFGSWSQAKRRAGLTDALPVYEDAAILEDLRRVSASFPGERFTQNFYLTHGGQYSHSIFKTRFGGWREALDAAGIVNRFAGRPTTERMRVQPGRTMSNKDILIQIRDIAARLGTDFLSGIDIAAHSEINQRLLHQRFGSVSAALRLAGIQQASLGRRHTEDEVFENLLNVWTHYGRQPIVSEMDKPPSTVGKSTYIHRYGGWRKALKAFIDYANSETDSGQGLDINQIPSNLPNEGELEKGPPGSAAGPSQPQTESQIRSRNPVKKPAPPKIKPEDRREPSIGLRYRVLRRDRFRCQKCGRSPATHLDCVLHVDHKDAFSKKGKTTFENLQTLCSRCNIGKSNRSSE